MFVLFSVLANTDKHPQTLRGGSTDGEDDSLGLRWRGGEGWYNKEKNEWPSFKWTTLVSRLPLADVMDFGITGEQPMDRCTSLPVEVFNFFRCNCCFIIGAAQLSGCSNERRTSYIDAVCLLVIVLLYSPCILQRLHKATRPVSSLR